MDQAKPFDIPKKILWEAYKHVKQNKGTYGVDEVSIQEFEINLKDNLYKLWNRMSSGSYFPPPVRRVEIPKKDGSKRPLGIPTVCDRVAQSTVKIMLEPKVEPVFHPDSYGYRPGKSAIQAIGQTRQRCWRYDWVLDLDIKGFFDNLDHELLMERAKDHTDSKWMLLYIKRWLKAPVELEDGTQISPQKGTPQGGVISPLLANIFLHYAFDVWMKKNFPDIPFERYADDIVVHCPTKAKAEDLRKAAAERLAGWKLELNPEKTRVVYCKDSNRRESYLQQRFDFLGYTFHPRTSINKEGERFVSFSPAVNPKVAKTMRVVMRSWCLDTRTPARLEELATWINPITRGWIGYYGHYHKSALFPTFRQLDRMLVRWAMRKHKGFRKHRKRARKWLAKIADQNPTLFAHWHLLFRTWPIKTIRAV